VDGTYELFRRYYGLPPARDRGGHEVAAPRGVLSLVAGYDVEPLKEKTAIKSAAIVAMTMIGSPGISTSWHSIRRLMAEEEVCSPSTIPIVSSLRIVAWIGAGTNLDWNPANSGKTLQRPARQRRGFHARRGPGTGS